MVEVVDGADALAFSESTPRTRSQHRHPQQHYEDQQDQNRHSPDDLPSRLKKSLMKGSFQMVDGGEMHSADLVGTPPLRSFVPIVMRGESRGILPFRLGQAARPHHLPSVQPTVTGIAKQADTLLRGDDLVEHSGRHETTRRHQARVGETGWDLLAVMGDQDQRWAGRIVGQGWRGAASSARGRQGPVRRRARRAGSSRDRSSGPGRAAPVGARPRK